MLKKINRQKAIDNFPIFPLRHYDFKKDEEIFNYPKVYANYILTLPSKSYKGHIKLLTTEVVNLTKYFKSNTLTFLGDNDTSWLKRLNTYDSFQDSLVYLMDNKIGKKYNGALQVDLEELPIFLTNLTWLVRTNGVLPYIYFVDKEQSFIADFCQYGNLHISPINQIVDKTLKEFISVSKFEFLNNSNCINKFSKTNKIKGRTIKV